VADDNAVFQDLAEEDEVLETLVTVPEQEVAPIVAEQEVAPIVEVIAQEPEIVTPEAQTPVVEAVSLEEVTSEEEPPETSAL
jgi:hypothetical protein